MESANACCAGDDRSGPRNSTWISTNIGFESIIEMDKAPKGLNEDIIPLHLGQEGRARVDGRMASVGLSPDWLTMGRARPGRGVHYPKIRFQKKNDLYYYAAPEEPGRAENRSTRSIFPKTAARSMKSSVFRFASRKSLQAVEKPAAEDGEASDNVLCVGPCGRLTPCSISVSVVTTFQEGARQGRPVIFMSFSEAVREYPELGGRNIWVRWCRPRDKIITPRGAQLGRLHRRFLRLSCRRAYAAPMELSTYFRINREEHRPVSSAR